MKVKVMLKMLLYGEPEPPIKQNPEVYRRMVRGKLTVYDKETKAKVGSYEDIR